MYGVDYAYAATRLVGTFVRLMTGQPIQVNDISTIKGTVNYTDLRTGLDANTHLDEVNTCPMPLGYYNFKGGVYYMSRKPTRKYRQGLSSANINIVARNGEPVRYAAVFNAVCFCDTVEGKYPSFKRALEILGNKPVNPFSKVQHTDAIAWHRFWAMSVDNKVYYRGKHVGYLEAGKVCLSSKYLYLKESLEESL